MTPYVIRVGGWLSDDMLTAFPRLLATQQPVSTLLRGELPDQAALGRVLDFLDELGVEIVEVTKLPSDGSPVVTDSEAGQGRRVPTAGSAAGSTGG